MSIETFNYPVQAGVNESVKANINRVQFDDGYEQRSKKGIKNLKRTFSVKFKGTYFNKNGKIIVDGDSKAVTDFLERQEGYKAFNWTSYLSPNSKPIKVYCQEWSPVYDNGVIEISMTFKETL
nr:MAG TPA: minor tail protein [Caudoviricetes sp.]